MNGRQLRAVDRKARLDASRAVPMGRRRYAFLLVRTRSAALDWMAAHHYAHWVRQFEAWEIHLQPSEPDEAYQRAYAESVVRQLQPELGEIEIEWRG